MESCIIIGGSERGGGYERVDRPRIVNELVMTSAWMVGLVCAHNGYWITNWWKWLQVRAGGEKGRGEGWVTRSTDGTLMTSKGSIAYLVYATLKLLKHFSCFWGTLTLSTRINLKYFPLKKSWHSTAKFTQLYARALPFSSLSLSFSLSLFIPSLCLCR